jgi:hypothetical protein
MIAPLMIELASSASSSSGTGCSSTMARLQRFSKVPVLVEHVGDAARHAGGEIAPGRAEIRP